MAETPTAIDLIYYPFDNDTVTKVKAMRGSVTITNPLFIYDSGSDHDCSFNGGCNYYFSGNGMPGVFIGEPHRNYVWVCGSFRCEIDLEQSTDVTVVCLLPPLTELIINGESKVDCLVDLYHEGSPQPLNNVIYIEEATSTLTSLTPPIGP